MNRLKSVVILLLFLDLLHFDYFESNNPKWVDSKEEYQWDMDGRGYMFFSNSIFCASCLLPSIEQSRAAC